MRGNRKQPERQSQFAVTTNTQDGMANPDKLLNEIYQRIKSKSIEETRQVNTSQSNIVLLSYLSKSNHQNTETKESIQKLKESLERTNAQNIEQTKIKRHKKFSENERVRTEFDDTDSVTQIQHLRRQNEMLKNKLTTCEKKVIYLQAFQGEVEYLKKLVFIQNTEIQKLRRVVKNAKREQLELFDQENKLLQCASVGLKEVKGKKSPILISDQSSFVDNQGKSGLKKKKCFHKLKEEGLARHIRTESIVDVNSNSKNRSFHSKSKEEIAKKNSCKVKRQKNLCR